MWILIIITTVRMGNSVESVPGFWTEEACLSAEARVESSERFNRHSTVDAFCTTAGYEDGEFIDEPQ